jgi:cell division protein ZapE
VATESQSVSARLSAEVAGGRLDFDPGQQEVAARLDRLSEELHRQASTLTARLRAKLPWRALGPDPSAPRGLYIWGGVGRGKTLLLDLFVETAPLAAERSHFYHFMRQVHAELRSVKSRSEPLELVAQRLAGRARIICLDEFFVSDIADAMILAGLFEGLFRRGVTLVTTSNLAPDELYTDGLQRQRFLPAIELIQRHVEVVHLDAGIDYRLRQLEQSPTYLDAALDATPGELRRRFSLLAGGHPAGPGTISIEGRTIGVVNRGPGMVWLEFAELCAGPRSQNDYIELARLYHTIFISNIPQFTSANENAARRFIMLIDELYDRAVNIVASAAAPPADLYRGERLGLEFQRTASRLVEMQSQHYLARQHRP